MRNSIRTRLTWAFIGLAIGPLLLVGVALAWQSFTTQRQQASNLQREMAQRVSTQVRAYFEGLENELHLTGQVQGLQKLDRDKQSSVLSRLLAYHDVFEELALLDGQGQEQIRLSRTGLAPELRDRSQADEFTASQTSGETYYSPVQIDEATGEPFITIAVPLFDMRSGRVDGVIVSEVRIKKIWELIANIEVSAGQSAYIVDARGQVVAHRNPSVVLGGASFRVPDEAGIQPGLDGSSVILAADRVSVGGQEFNVVVEQTVTEALALAINTVLIIAGLILVALAVSGTLGFLTVRQIVQPIQTMAAAAQAISAGDLSRQVQIARRDEVGILGEAFNSMTAQLQSLISGLEQRVAERTRALAQRSGYQEATARVAREASATLDVASLLPRVANLISEQFSFYHAGIFLLDATGEWAELKAVSSEGGQRMLQRGHRLRVEDKGIVGYVAHRGQSRVVLDTSTDTIFLRNPDLPDTRAEMALPLQARGKIIGVLDVQSTAPQAFSEEDVAVLQTLADQVALAISNAQLFAQVEESLEVERRAYGELSRQAWTRLLTAQSDLGVVSSQQGLASAVDAWEPQMHEAMRKRQATIASDAETSLAVPIQVRDQVIGVINVERPEGAGEWTSDQVAMVQTLTEQLGLALDGARLYQDVQRTAARERVIGEVTGRMRETLDLNTILQSAVREIGSALDADVVEVRLGTGDSGPR